MAQPPVMLYALSTCGHCRNAKKFLDKNEVAYDVVDVDRLAGDERTQVVEKVKALNPSLSFPTIVIGDKVIVGYKEQDYREALGL